MTGVLEGKVAVVTGSGQGVGRGIAILLARAGAKVVTNNRKPRHNLDEVNGFQAAGSSNEQVQFSDDEKAKYSNLAGDASSTAKEINDFGGEAAPFFGDVSDYKVAGELIDFAVSRFGRIDILVNNAAGLGFGHFINVTEGDWHYQVDAKLKGAFNCMKHAVPKMIEQGFGRILNTSSDAWTGIAALSPYSAANAALVGLTVSTAKELRRYGITVNAFCPQAESPGHLSFTATLRDMMDKNGVKISNPERLRASEEAHASAENLTFLSYLASDDAAYISGSVFSVTAGGDIALYSRPTHESRISKKGSAWTFDELSEAVPGELLRNYVSPAEVSEF